MKLPTFRRKLTYHKTVDLKTLICFLGLFCSALCFGQNIRFVTSLADSGPGSLRSVISNASDGNSIYINAKGTIQLQSPINIDKSVSIVGPMPMHLSIDGTNSGVIFNVIPPAGAELTFSGIKFQNSTNTAIIVNNTLLTIEKCVFENNTGIEGGAINNTSGVIVDGCSFLGNSALQGGAIYSSDYLESVNSTYFQNNVADDGAAIYLDSSTASLSFNTFKENDAIGLGGAIYSQAGFCSLYCNLFCQNGTSTSSMDFNLDHDGNGFFSSSQGNFFDSNPSSLSTVFMATGTDYVQFNADPKLSANLHFDGYGFAYFPIIDGTSPAIDLGNANTTQFYDQRNCYRQMTMDTINSADAGAIEYTPYIITDTDGSNSQIPGSMSWAIAGINSSQFPSSIVFDLSGPSAIMPSQTYVINQECIVAGYTQMNSICPGPADPNTGDFVTPASPIIEFDGTNVSSSNPGIYVNGANSVIIRGLSIFNYSNGAGIKYVNSDFANVLGCHIGTNSLNGDFLGNNKGVEISSNCNYCTIGDWSYHNRNVIANSSTEGVLIRGSSTSYNTVVNNLIGVDAHGDTPRPNENGVLITDSTSWNKIGDSLIYRNIISSNFKHGIIINDTLADANGIYGNFIGTDISGQIAMPNNIGVRIDNAANLNFIGNKAGQGNVISGNDSCGIYLSAWTNFVYNNIIGLNVEGNTGLGNGEDGIFINNPTGWSNIGWHGKGLGNIIADNGHHGINAIGYRTSTIANNLIGLGADTLTAFPNQGDGIHLGNLCYNVQIGGNQFEFYNIIGANDSSAIHLQNTSGGHNIVGNFIGFAIVNNNFQAFGNGLHGIFVDENSFWGNVIGESVVGGNFNYIAFNIGHGIHIPSDQDNQMYRNIIAENGGLAINLGTDNTPTLNDNLDIDGGANELTNFPEINTASSCSNGVIIDGVMNGLPNQPYRIEFYSTSILDPSGYGEAEEYLGFLTDTTDATGNFSYNLFLNTHVPSGHYVSGTATLEQFANKNTSELGLGVLVSGGPPAPIGSPDVFYCDGSTATLAGSAAGTGQIVWSFDSEFIIPIDTNAFTISSDSAGQWTYYLAEIVGNGCLSEYDSIVVTVDAIDDPSFTYPSFCSNVNVLPTSITTPGGVFEFDPPPGDGAMIDAITGEISNAVANTTYSVQYITPNTCNDSSIVQVFAVPIPSLNVLNIVNEGCEGAMDGEITLSTGSGGTFLYSLDSGATTQASGIFTGLGANNYIATIIDPGSLCTNSTNVSVQFDYPNTLVASPDQTICAGDAVTLSASGTGTISWIGTDIGLVQNEDITVTPSSSSAYLATLSTANCTFTDTVLVLIDNTSGCNSFVTNNAFSPNNDGVNDTWIINQLNNYPENKVVVMNRWGDKVWEVDGYNNSTKVWDGTGPNGNLVPDDTYYYVIELPNTQTVSGWVQITQ